MAFWGDFLPRYGNSDKEEALYWLEASHGYSHGPHGRSSSSPPPEDVAT